MSTIPDPLFAAETYARLVEATSTMRHDVRNKLAAIKNAAFYLKRKTEKTPLWEEDKRVPTFFGLIDSEMLAAENMMGKLAGPASLFERSPRTIDPVACVERAFGLMRLSPETTLTFETRFESRGASMEADPDELAVAVRSLLENAVDAAPAGSSITVSTLVKEGTVQIDVEDDGPGLPAELVATAFRPFVTGRPGRAGLGLPIALRVARKHMGSVVFVEGVPRTCVRMTLHLEGSV